MTETEVINKFFNQKNWRGIRTCKYSCSFRIRGCILQRYYEGMGDGWWDRASWEEFHIFLTKYFENLKRSMYINSVGLFDWDFGNDVQMLEEKKALLR